MNTNIIITDAEKERHFQITIDEFQSHSKLYRYYKYCDPAATTKALMINLLKSSTVTITQTRL